MHLTKADEDCDGRKLDVIFFQRINYEHISGRSVLSVRALTHFVFQNSKNWNFMCPKSQMQCLIQLKLKSRQREVRKTSSSRRIPTFRRPQNANLSLSRTFQCHREKLVLVSLFPTTPRVSSDGSIKNVSFCRLLEPEVDHFCSHRFDP